MTGQIKPRTIRVSRPMLEETNGGRTDVGPMIARLAAARDFEQRADGFEILVVTIARQMLDLQQFKSFGIEPESKRMPYRNVPRPIFPLDQ